VIHFWTVGGLYSLLGPNLATELLYLACWVNFSTYSLIYATKYIIYQIGGPLYIDLHFTSHIPQCYQHRQRQNIVEGTKTKISATSGKISENVVRTKKIQKYSFFFSIFKISKASKTSNTCIST
jgi:hypothetical protein